MKKQKFIETMSKSGTLKDIAEDGYISKKTVEKLENIFDEVSNNHNLEKETLKEALDYAVNTILALAKGTSIKDLDERIAYFKNPLIYPKN
jgi:hypothetical protein